MQPFTRMYERELRLCVRSMLHMGMEPEEAVAKFRERHEQSPFPAALEKMAESLERELFRMVRIREGHPPIRQSRLRQRYYHPTKGWRLPNSKLHVLEKING